MGDLPDLVRRAPGPLRSLAGACPPGRTPSAWRWSVSAWPTCTAIAVTRPRARRPPRRGADGVALDGLRRRRAARPLAHRRAGPRRGVRRPRHLVGHVHPGHRGPGRPGLAARHRAWSASASTPAPVLPSSSSTSPSPGEVEGRPCWVVDARPGCPAGRRRGAAATSPLSGGRRAGASSSGVDHRFWFDAETGVVLRHQGSVDGETCSTHRAQPTWSSTGRWGRWSSARRPAPSDPLDARAAPRPPGRRWASTPTSSTSTTARPSAAPSAARCR